MSKKRSARNTRPVAAFMFKLPFMIDCVTFDEFIMGYFEGTLTGYQKFTFNMHLRMCRECRIFLAEYKASIELAKSQRDILFSEMDMGDVPEDLIKAVIESQKGP
ncbi:MAG: hypothetical protein AAF412_07225 [Pseudomonadota bacterium]